MPRDVGFRANGADCSHSWAARGSPSLNTLWSMSPSLQAWPGSHTASETTGSIRGRVLVFDMGGGTLDVALLQVDTTSGDHGEISVSGLSRYQ